MIVKGILKEEGYTFDQAMDGEEALNMYEQNEYDCIVLDLLMPKKDGVEVLEELKTKENSTPVIVLTADIQEKRREQCIELGANEFLNKPINKSEFMEAINRVLA